MKFTRYDRITLDRARALMLDNGMMRVPAKISRVGVQEYRRGDGSIERAYRPPNEVGAQQSVATFDARPVVVDHPRENGSVVDAKNVKRLGVGVVLNPVFRDGFIEADLLIQDADAVDAVKSGKVELSAGYFMDRDETPGVSPEGQSYDFVQRNIRANHVAIVDEGRAGPQCRIELDAVSTDFPAMSAGDRPKGETNMLKMTIDGVEVEVSNLAATLFQKERTMAAGLLDSAKAEIQKKTAQCDALTEKVSKLETDLKAAPEKARAMLVERAALEAKVKTVAPDLKCDGLDDLAVKKAACEKHGIKLDGKPDSYIAARFDVLAEESEKKNPAAQAVADALKAAPGAGTEPTLDLAEIKKKANEDFFKTPAAK